MLNLNSHSLCKRQKRTSGIVKKIWDDLGRKVLLCQMNFCCGKVLHKQQLQLNQSRIHVHSKVGGCPTPATAGSSSLGLSPSAHLFSKWRSSHGPDCELSQDSLTVSIFFVQNDLVFSLGGLVHSDSNFIETWFCQPLAQYATLSLLLNSPCIFI